MWTVLGDELTVKGANFITEPLYSRGWEMRCSIRDPDGYIIEVGQSSRKMIEMFRKKQPSDRCQTKSILFRLRTFCFTTISLLIVGWVHYPRMGVESAKG
jgi:hypothetical protein